MTFSFEELKPSFAFLHPWSQFPAFVQSCYPEYLNADASKEKRHSWVRLIFILSARPKFFLSAPIAQVCIPTSLTSSFSCSLQGLFFSPLAIYLRENMLTVVVGVGHGGKYKITPLEMPELIRVGSGCELTSHQASGILSCREAELNKKDGWRSKG